MIGTALADGSLVRSMPPENFLCVHDLNRMAKLRVARSRVLAVWPERVTQPVRSKVTYRVVLATPGSGSQYC